MTIEFLHEFFHGPVYFFAGYFVHSYVARRKEENSKPYTWTCLEEDCIFKVESNSAALTIELADAHTATAHKSY